MHLTFTKRIGIFLFLLFAYVQTTAQFDPKQISNLALWLRADTGISLISGAVSQWSDISGNGNHATQSTAGARPVIDSSMLINSRKAVRFDGTNDLLNGSIISGADTSLSVFIVTNGNAVVNANAKNFFALGAVTNGMWLYQGVNPGIFYYRNNGVNYVTPISVPHNGFPFTLLEVVRAYNTNVACYKNAALSTTLSSAAAGSFTNGAYAVGNGNAAFLKADIAEIIVYTKALTAIERDLVEKYIFNRYAPPVSLGPDVHQTFSLCPVTLNAGNRFASYQWSNSQTTQTIQVTKSGTYSVTTTDVFGRQSSDTIVVSIPQATLLQSDTTICLGSSLTIKSILSDTAGYTFLWQNGSANPTYTSAQQGNYFVRVSDGTCFAYSDTLTLAVDSFSTTVSLGADTSVCAGALIGLKSPPSNWSGFSFSWSGGITDSLITVNTSGAYNLTVQNNFGCSATDAINVIVSGSLPLANFANDTLCTGETFYPLNTSQSTDTSTIVSYLWAFDAGNFSSAFQPTFLFATSGSHVVSLKVTTSVGCANTKTGFVLVNNKPVADFTVDTSCINVATIFSDLSSVGVPDNIVQWQWSFGDGGGAASQNSSHFYVAGNNYNVQHIATSNTGCSDTITKTTVVVNSATAPLVPSLLAPVNGASFAGNQISFSWQFSPGAIRYTLLVSTVSNFSTYTTYNTGNTNQYNLSLLGNQTYYWKIRAYNICNDSSQSGAKSFFIFSPSDISGLTLWLRADTGLVLTPASNPPTIQQWSDISGMGYHVTQATVNARPRFVTPIDELNSLPVVRFNGTNNVLNGTTIAGADSSSLSIFVVAKGNNTTNANAKNFLALGSLTNGMWLYQGINPGTLYYRNNGTNYTTNISLPHSGFPHSLMEVVKGYSSKVFYYKNGALFGSDTAAAAKAFTNGSISIGSGNTTFLSADIAEIIVYKSGLDSNQRKQIEQYIYNRYAPPVSLGPDIEQPYSLCPVTVDAGNRFITYQWSTGETTPSIQARYTGNYWVETVDVFGRISRDTIHIAIPYLGVSTTDTTVCNYSSLSVSVLMATTPYSFLWSSQQITQAIVPTSTAYYLCAITDTNGCTFMSDSIRVTIDSFATLSILSDTAICSGNKLALKLVGYTPQSVLWNDGSSNNYNIVSTQGSYVVTVTDVNGCVNNDAAFVQVKSSAPSLSNFSAPNVCFGTPIQFTDLSNYEPNDPPKSWSWIFGDVQTVGSTQQNPTHLYLAPGDYSVTFTFLTDSGCSGQASKVVTAAIPPIPAFGFPTIICARTQVILSDQTVFLFGDSIANWVWTFNGVDSITTKNAVYEFPSQGSYLVKLKAISKSGCSDTTEQIVDVFPPLAADFSIQHVCLGDSTAFVDVTPALSVVGWQWNFGDFSFPSVQQSPKHKYATAGSYNVTLTVENAIGCVDNISKTVNVVTPPTAKFGNLVTCEDQYYAPLDSSIVSNDTISTWKWTIAGTNYNTQAPEHLFADTGNYNIKLKITTQSGCIDSANKIVSVKPHPKALFSFTPLYGDAPVDVSFINQSTNASNYFWDFGDGITSSDPAPFHTYNTNDTFSIRLKATSNYGCEDSSQRTFIVAPTDLDVAVLSVTTTKKEQPDGSYLITAKAKVANLGTRIITNVQFYVTIGSGGVVSEEWVPDFTFATGMTPDVIFTAQFVVAAENANSYVCVTAVSVNNGETEISTANNSQCSTTSEGIQLIGPSPNPMSSQAQLGIILPKAGEVTIDIADMAGQYVVQGQLLDLPKGRSNYTLPVDKMLAAEYFIRVYYNDEKLVRKFIVAK